MSEDYYKILSVEPTASQKEIQQAADRLISNWDEKRGLSNQKRSEILSQIRKASAVLTDPLQRFEYDINHGFKRDFSEQSSMKKSPFIPLKYSESIETIDTIKIPGELDYEKLEKSISTMETTDLTEVKDLHDIIPFPKSASLKKIRSARVIDEISKNRPGSETDADIIRERDRFKGNSSNLKQDFATDDLKTSGKEPAVPLDVDKGKKKKKTIMQDWKDSLSETEISSEPVESVTATKRIAGTDVKTVYSFGSDTDFIEVFVNGGLRVKIVNGQSHGMYCKEMKHDDLPPGVIVGASTVIAANSCIITTEVTRRGKRESIAVYKNDTLLCRTGSTILED